MKRVTKSINNVWMDFCRILLMPVVTPTIANKIGSSRRAKAVRQRKRHIEREIFKSVRQGVGSARVRSDVVGTSEAMLHMRLRTFRTRENVLEDDGCRYSYVIWNKDLKRS